MNIFKLKRSGFRTSTPSTDLGQVSLGRRSSGFTLIELLVVIVIIGVLATLATIALNSIRAKARDAKRISDVKQMQTALELYFSDENTYPTTLAFGAPLIGPSNNRTYMAKLPNNPSPRVEGACTTDSDYSYTQGAGGNSYMINYCLAKSVDNLVAGPAYATQKSIHTSTSTQGAACVAPATVSGLSATSGYRQVSLSWTAVPYASSYQICYSTNSSACTMASFTPIASSTTSNLTVSGLVNGTTYYFTVKAVGCDSLISADPSNQQSAAPAPIACPGTPTVLDNSGSITYNTIWLDFNNNLALDSGECWTKENLATTVKQDGVTALNHSTSGDYMCPPNTSKTAEDCAAAKSGSTSILGNIYSWDAALALLASCDTTDCSGSIAAKHRGLCPSGWHVPSDAEWATLINYAEDIATAASGSTCANAGLCSNASGVLKEANTNYWDSLGTPAATNALGLTIRGAGYYMPSAWYNRGVNAYFWAASQSTANNGFSRALNTNNTSFGRYTYTKLALFSIRCVKD